jgi:hypothetical protein
MQIFVKKKGIFRPAGGENAFWVSNRVSPENDPGALECYLP